MNKIRQFELRLKRLNPYNWGALLTVLVSMGLAPGVNANPNQGLIAKTTQHPIELNQPPVGQNPGSRNLVWQPVEITRRNSVTVNPNSGSASQKSLTWRSPENNQTARNPRTLAWQGQGRSPLTQNPINTIARDERQMPSLSHFNGGISRHNPQPNLGNHNSDQARTTNYPTRQEVAVVVPETSRNYQNQPKTKPQSDLRSIPVIFDKDYSKSLEQNASEQSNLVSYQQQLRETPVIFQKEFPQTVNSNGSTPENFRGYHRTLAEMPLISQRNFSEAIGLGGTRSQTPIASNPQPTNQGNVISGERSSNPNLIAQNQPEIYQPDREEINRLQSELEQENLEERVDFGGIMYGSPSLTILNPTGFGADFLTVFGGAAFQERTRYSDDSDGGMVLGVGLGDARKAVGVELSYTIASFGTNRDFGTGGFNMKVHRIIKPDLAAAIGWNGFLNVGDDHDFEHSVYGVVTKVFRTRDDITLPFSRIAVSAGVGSGQFRSEGASQDDVNEINGFGSIAVRIVEPVSLITEWTGQDLALGISVAPFKNIPLVITPAVRDITGAGDGPRFVLGAGFAYQFK
jgi:hypothetical protein